MRPLREVRRRDQRDIIVDDLGVPQRAYNLAFTDGSTINVNDGVILVPLKEGHAPTAEYVRRLREVRNGTDRLLVMVLDPPEPVLPSRARAELVAALAVVDYVVPIEKHKAEELLRHFDAGEIVREESADLTRARALAEHVHGRQHT